MLELKGTSHQNDLAAELCDAGNQCIHAAQQTAFDNPQVLTKAAECFLTAIEIAPTCVDAYLGIAFLTALSGLYDQAQDVIRQAQQLAPRDVRIPALYKEIQTMIQKAPDLKITQLQSLDQLLGPISFAQTPTQTLLKIDQQLSPKLHFLQD
jgi:tetratricopeptide (TPR) repeat protein